jgi:hypothetical protein
MEKAPGRLGLYISAGVVAVLLLLIYTLNNGSLLQGNLGAANDLSNATVSNQATLDLIRSDLDQTKALVEQMRQDVATLKERYDVSFPVFTSKIEALEQNVEELKAKLAK